MAATCTSKTLPGGTVEGELTPQGLNNGGKFTRVTIDDTGWTALPPTPLTDRNEMSVQNLSGSVVLLNHPDITTKVPPGAGVTDGLTLPDSFSRQYAITDTVQVYARAAAGAGSITVEVEELS